MKGYKMLNSDMTSSYGGITYELGNTYKIQEQIIPCFRGYHFCKELTRCLSYYPNMKCDKRFFEIETGDNIVKRGDKYVTDEITLVRELSLDEVFEYIRNNKDKVNWYYISKHLKLSEDFIREFQNRVNWYCISVYQQLSEDFIREFENWVDWFYISRCQKLSEEFKQEFKDKLTMWMM